MDNKIRHIKEIKCKWKECLGILEGTKLLVHNIRKETSPDDLKSAVSELNLGVGGEHKVMISVCYQGSWQEWGSRTAVIETTKFKPALFS